MSDILNVLYIFLIWRPKLSISGVEILCTHYRANLFLSMVKLVFNSCRKYDKHEQEGSPDSAPGTKNSHIPI